MSFLSGLAPHEAPARKVFIFSLGFIHPRHFRGRSCLLMVVIRWGEVSGFLFRGAADSLQTKRSRRVIRYVERQRFLMFALAS